MSVVVKFNPNHDARGRFGSGGTGGSGETHAVMRGVAMNLPAGKADEVHRLLQPPQSESEIDQHFAAGKILLDEFVNRGGGQHWTGSSRGIAEIGAGARAGGTHVPVIVHATYSGPRFAAGRSTIHDEDEHTIPPGTHMRVTGIEVKTADGWVQVLKDPHDIVLGQTVTKSVVVRTPMLKHPGHPDQKVHGRRHATTVNPAVASKTMEMVRENGGLSIKMTDGSEPPSGYMVARNSTKFGTVVSAQDFYDPVQGPRILADHLNNNRSELGSGRAYLGVWHQKQEQGPDGKMRDLPFAEQKVHLDVTDMIVDREQAVRLGRRRNQISVWDVANFDEIATGGTGGEVSKRTIEGFSDAETVDSNVIRRDPAVGHRTMDGARSGSAVVFFPVGKHGHHDQKTHGRRAGTRMAGIADDVMAGKPVTIEPADVKTLLTHLSARDGQPDLTNVTVIGHEGKIFDAPNIGVPRSGMPQVPSKMKPEFVDSMARDGYRVTRESVDPLSLNIVQAEISGKLSGQIMEASDRTGPPQTDKARIIISSDGYVLDGHHRWAAVVALHLAGDSRAADIPVFRLDATRDQGLKILHQWANEHNVESLGMGETQNSRAANKSVVVKFNPHHDSKGRFGTGGTGGGAAAGSVKERVAAAQDSGDPMGLDYSPNMQEKFDAYVANPDQRTEMGLQLAASANAYTAGLRGNDSDYWSMAVQGRAYNAIDQNKHWDTQTDQQKADTLSGVNFVRQNGTVCVAAPMDASIGALEDGRFKSQFETGSSRGYLDEQVRSVQETAMFDTHPSMAVDRRPIYGFVSLNADHTTAGVGQYGEVRFVLKPHARERTTMTVGDSLSTRATPVPMNGTITARQAHDACAIRYGTMHNAEVVQSFPTITSFHSREYFEAQIHHGVSMADVAEIHVDGGESDFSSSTVRNLRDGAARHGIPVIFHE